MGASTFIRKPTEPDAFIQILEEVFEKAKSGLLAPTEVPPLEPSLYPSDYNKRLVAKLDKKVAQLEEAEGKLRHANSVLRAITLTRIATPSTRNDNPFLSLRGTLVPKQSRKRKQKSKYKIWEEFRSGGGWLLATDYCILATDF